MSFEKLREIMLVIGIGLFLTVALIIAFISTLNARKGGQTVIAVQDVLIKGFQKSDTLRSKSTITKFAADLGDKQVGDLKIDVSKMYVLNIDGDTQVQSGDISALAANTEFPDEIIASAPNGKLQIAFIPSVAIKHATPVKYTVLTESKMFVNQASTGTQETDVSKYNESLRGFMSSGYMSFWGFAKEDDAKSFRDKFFPSGMTLKRTDTNWGIALEMAVN